MKFRGISSFLILSGLLFYCKTGRPSRTQQPTGNKETHSPATSQTSSPVLSPQEALERFRLEEGFEISLVASEPLVNTPVAMTFDGKGRLWVVEMPGYMPDTAGTGEEAPNGTIVILEDRNGDGVMDHRKVFLDSLVLPRAIQFVEDGLLVAEPPALWYYKIENDRPGVRQLVDPEYAVGGNVEHQPNGLLRALDNWIYNAKSDKRYRKQGDKWLIEPTHFRGQWGLSQDNAGKLRYNHNSANVLGDYFLPGFGSWNRHQKKVSGFNAAIVPDNRVYPLHPTPGVNRGYMNGILDSTKRLVNFTAACGPLVYRGDLFGPAYRSNVFVPEPSANLVKRNILTPNGYLTKGEQAYSQKEFLASTDERFRPVALYDGPDGGLYLVDMYRGIIQHKTYLTPYLKGEIAKRNLTPPLHYGRIYRIAPKGSRYGNTAVRASSAAELVKLLGHPNGWLRDYAQQQLVDRKDPAVVPLLRAALKACSDETAQAHILWTLEGLGALTATEVLACFKAPSFYLREQAFGLTPSVLTAGNYREFTARWNALIQEKDSLSFPYIAFALHSVMPHDEALALATLKKVAEAQPDNPYVASAVISNLYDREEQFLNALALSPADTAREIGRQLNAAIASARNARANRDPALLARTYPKGAELYNTVCQTCHGPDGNGVQNLAPPLNKSEWVTGDKTRLLAIVLFGLTGPVKVNNHLYRAPEINADMPGIGYDPEMKNEQIAELLSFIRKSWQNNAGAVEVPEVEKVRERFSRR